jgi:hypothetical protein
VCDLEWQKSSFSGDVHQECIELAAPPHAHTPTRIHLRESDDPGTVLTATPAAIRALLSLVRAAKLA